MQKVDSLNQNKIHENASTGARDNYGYQLQKDVVLYVLKQSILEYGTDAFDLVNRSLFEKYHCEISDCFEKPEYLVDVFRYVYDGSYTAIVESIKLALHKFAEERSIKEFLKKLS